MKRQTSLDKFFIPRKKNNNQDRELSPTPQPARSSVERDTSPEYLMEDVQSFPPPPQADSPSSELRESLPEYLVEDIQSPPTPPQAASPSSELRESSPEYLVEDIQSSPPTLNQPAAGFNYQDIGVAVRRKREGLPVSDDQIKRYLEENWKPNPGFQWPWEERVTKGRKAKYFLNRSLFDRFKWLTFSESEGGLFCKEGVYLMVLKFLESILLKFWIVLPFVRPMVMCRGGKVALFNPSPFFSGRLCLAPHKFSQANSTSRLPIIFKPPPNFL